MFCRFEVELLCSEPPNLKRKQQVYALQGPDAATELAMLATLQHVTVQSLPILPALMRHAGTSVAPAALTEHQQECGGSIIVEGVDAAVGEAVDRFSLNAEQAAVLSALKPWFLQGSKASSPTSSPQTLDLQPLTPCLSFHANFKIS